MYMKVAKYIYKVVENNNKLEIIIIQHAVINIEAKADTLDKQHSFERVFM